jgi:hypothetical protein
MTQWWVQDRTNHNRGPFTTFHFNGDFRGDVEIVRHGGSSHEERMRVPMEVLDILFAERIRRQRISRIEQMSDQALIDESING